MAGSNWRQPSSPYNRSGRKTSEINWQGLDQLVKKFSSSSTPFQENYSSKENSADKAINFLNSAIAQGKLPKDGSCTNIMKDIYYEEKNIDKVNRLFNSLKSTSACGLYMYTKIIHFRRENSQFSELEKLFEECRSKMGPEVVDKDPWIVGAMMCEYFRQEKYHKGIELFKLFDSYQVEDDTIQDDFDRQSCHYLNNPKIEKDQDYDYICKRLDKRIKDTLEKKLKHKKDKDKLLHYDAQIHYCFIKGDKALALKLFDKARKESLFSNNLINFTKIPGGITLNLHLADNCKKTEGGLSLAVAKAALLCFARDYEKEGDHLDVVIITGGVQHDSTVLKDNLPLFLSEAFNLPKKDIQLDTPNKGCFTIPYAAWRTYVICTQQSEKSGSDEAKAEKRRYYGMLFESDMRKKNAPSKSFSIKEPSIPLSEQQKLNRDQQEILKQADKHFKDRKLKEESDCYENLLKKITESVWLHTKYGWALFQKRAYDAAILQYKLAIKNYESIKNKDQKMENKAWAAEAFRKLGWTYDRKYREDGDKKWLNLAISYYENALEIDPDNFEIHNNFGITLVALDRNAEAKKHFDLLKENQKNHYECCVHLGDISLKQNQTDEAISYYAEAIKRNPKNAWSFYRMGCARKERKELREAMQSFDKSIELNNDLSNKAYAELRSLFTVAEEMGEVGRSIAKEIQDKYPELFQRTQLLF